MTWWKAAYLEALVRMYPTLYLRELQQILASDFHLAPGDVPSIASVAKLFIRLRITRKKCIHVAQERMTPYNLHCRQLYFQWRRTVDPAKVFFSTRRTLIARLMSVNMGRQTQDLRVRSFGRKAEHELESSPL